jgi:glutamate racemase
MSVKLGIIDWGIGGVGVYREIKKRAPQASIVYFSDTGVTPYGKQSRHHLAARLDKVIEYLYSNGCGAVAIGCNAASTAIGDLRTDVPVFGVIEPAVELAAKLRPEKLGLIGGRRTVMSGAYRRRFAENGIAVKQRVAQPLSALIEAGKIDSPEMRAEAARIMRPLKNCTHILHACTHYPAAEGVLAEFVSQKTKFLDPAAALARSIPAKYLKGDGSDVFLTTGDAAAMRRSARLAFGVDIGRAKRVSL